MKTKRASKGGFAQHGSPIPIRLPQEMREQFMEEFTQAYLLLVPLDREGKVHVDMVRLEVEVF